MRARGLGSLLWLSLLVPPAAGCSDDTASCGETQACGGDVVGAWLPNTSCVSRASIQSRYMSELGAECPGGTTVSIVDATSQWAKVSTTFNSDGTYSGTKSFSASVTLWVPTECLVSRACADLDAEFRAMVDPATGIVSGSCRNADTACACTVTQQQPTGSEDGTYTTSGTMLTTTPAGGAAAEMPYCVKGSTLHLLSVDAAGVIASDIVLTRQ
jgi:hypothetical protein